MPSIRPVGASAKINMLVHADIGWGKTSLIGTGGKQFKTLIMRPPIDHVDPIIGSGCDEMVVKDWEEIFEGLDYMRHEGYKKYDWFWMDSISLLQDVGLDDVYQGVLDAKAAEKGATGAKARARFGPDRGEYRVNMWRLQQWIRYAVGAEAFNLGITAHSFWYEDPETNEPASQLMPWIQGKQMPSKICGMMNLVCFGELRTRTVRGEERLSRVLHTNKTERWYAKNQFKLPGGAGVFGDTGTIINPTMPEIVAAINKRSARTPTRRRTRRT
jgi:hypothetical protein